MIRIMTFQLSSNDWGACSKLTYLLRRTIRVHESYLHVTLCVTFMFTLYKVKELNRA